MVSRAVDRRRKSKRRKTRPANSGVRRSGYTQKHKRNVQTVDSFQAATQKTIFGEAALLVEGPYEIMLEIMSPKSSTGLIKSEKGTISVFCKSGDLHTYTEKDELKEHKRLRAGEFITIPPGTAYSLSSNEMPVDMLKVQTPKYIESLKQLTDSITPADTRHFVDMSGFVSPNAAREEAARTKYVRPARDRERKIAIAKMAAADRGPVNKRKAVTREARPPRSAQEVMSRTTFRQGGQNVEGVNLQPLNMGTLDAAVAADVRAAQAIEAAVANTPAAEE